MATSPYSARAIGPIPGRAATANTIGVISGYVTVTGGTAVAGCVVRLYDRVTGALVRQVLSNAAGFYRFGGLDPASAQAYYVVALDPDGGTTYDTVAHDRVTPYVPPTARTLYPQLVNTPEASRFGTATATT